MFKIDELENVKRKAIEDHIPIIMDDTLEKIEEILKQEKPKKILEIGTAVRIFCKSVCQIYRWGLYNWYYWNRWIESGRSKAKYRENWSGR